MPACQIQPHPVPISCFCHSSTPSSSRPFHPAALPALGFLPCSALELRPGVASWAASAQASRWGSLHLVQPLPLFLCCRVAPSPRTLLPSVVSAGWGGAAGPVRTSAALHVPVPGSGRRMVGCCKQDVSRTNVKADFGAGSDGEEQRGGGAGQVSLGLLEGRVREARSLQGGGMGVGCAVGAGQEQCPK